MKHLLALFSLLLPGLFLNAQISIDSSHVGAVGTTWYMAYDTLFANGENQGSAGSGQTWDFSQLSVHSVDTVTFVDPSTTPYGSFYPFTNLCIRTIDSDTQYVYAKLSASAFEAMAFAGDVGFGFVLWTRLRPSATIVPFPANMGLNYKDTSYVDSTMDAAPFGFPGIDSVRFSNITQRDVTFDASGTLKLPMGDINCIREKEITTSIDSVWTYSQFTGGWSLLDGTTATDSVFSWWSDTTGYILAEAEYVDGTLEHIAYQDTNPQIAVSVVKQISGTVTIYPVPAENSLNIRSDSPLSGELKIFDLHGKQVICRKLNTISDEQIELKGIESGVYFLEITTGEGSITEKIIVR